MEDGEHMVEHGPRANLNHSSFNSTHGTTLPDKKRENGTEKMRKLLGIKSKPENDKDANRNKAAARGEIAFDMMATIQSSGDTSHLLIILSSLLLISSAQYSKC